jgi:hypothetical protein
MTFFINTEKLKSICIKGMDKANLDKAHGLKCKIEGIDSKFN